MQDVKPVEHNRFADYPAKIAAGKRTVRAPQIRSLYGDRIGGKARGYKFLQELLLAHEDEIKREFGESLRIAFPKTTTLGTDLFFDIMDKNHLWDVVKDEPPNDIILREFGKAKFKPEQMHDLAEMLVPSPDGGHTRPIAARSTGINEDAERSNEAGIKWTVFIPNFHPSPQVRLEQLLAAILMVYASSFMNDARQYRRAKGISQSENDMGVIVQNLVGRLWQSKGGALYYLPEASLNVFSFDPFGGTGGYFNAALGLGPGVVENNKTSVRFRNRRPDRPVTMQDADQAVRSSPDSLYALVMDENDGRAPNTENFFLRRIGYEELGFGFIDRHMSSVQAGYGGDSGVVRNLVPYVPRDYMGPKVMALSRLMMGDFGPPLHKVVKYLEKILRKGFGNKVEFEASLDILGDNGNYTMVFYPLQARIQVKSKGDRVDALPEVEEGRKLLLAENAIGYGKKALHDVLYIAPPPEKFTLQISDAMGKELTNANKRMFSPEKKYLFFGPGRVCTQDFNLGIIGSFETISNAAAIGENRNIHSGLLIEPSGGAHISQNIMDMQMAYFSYMQHQLPIEKLRAMSTTETKLGEYVTHFTFRDGLKLDMDNSGNTVIYKV